MNDPNTRKRPKRLRISAGLLVLATYGVSVIAGGHDPSLTIAASAKPGGSYWVPGW